MGDRPPALNDIPLQAIEEAAKIHTDCQIRVSRRNGKGQVAALCNNVRFATLELANIDSWVRAFAGGGDYTIEAKELGNPTHYVVPPFKVAIEGVARPPQRQMLGSAAPDNIADSAATAADIHASAWGDPPPQTARSVVAGMDPYHAALAAADRRPPYAGIPYAPPAPGATVASDQLAMKQIVEMRQEIERERADRKALEVKLEQERRTHEADARRAAEERARSEITNLRDELRSLRTAPQGPNMVEMFTGLATAIAPVVTAMVTANQGRASAEMEQQTRRMELQQTQQGEFMKLMVTQSAPKQDLKEILTTIQPFVQPLLTQALERKDPEIQTRLFEILTNNSRESTAMMANMLLGLVERENQGKEPPWWLPMVKEALGGVVELADGYMTHLQKGSDAAGTPQLVAQGGAAQSSAYTTVEHEPAATTAPTAPTPVAPVVKPEAPVQPTNGGQVPLNLEAKVLLTLVPAEFKTPEWQAILIGLHQTAPQTVVAQMIVEHLKTLIEANKIPPQLVNFAEDPEGAIRRVFQKLPIYKHDAQYCEAVIQLSLQMLIDDGVFNVDDVPADAEVDAN